MPTLHWIGKDKIINHHKEVPFRVLEQEYIFSPNTSEVGDEDNKIIHGDNLAALKSLLPQYEGKIKCIYIDPPYNTGNENWVYNDNLTDPKLQKWLGQVVGKEAEDLTRHDKWLCMMYPRLKLLHKLLADDGAIFISIDDNELAHLKLICDEIFGRGNFVGTYFWYKSSTPPNLSYKIKRNIEYVICYSKTGNSNKFLGLQKSSKSDDPVTKPQNSFKDLTFPKGSMLINLENQIIEKGIYGTAKFPNELLNDLIIQNKTNANDVTFRNRFIWLQEKLDEELKNGTQIKINAKSLVISYKKLNYEREVPPSFIGENVEVDTTENAGKLLDEIFGEKVFDYPKPPSLIEYLINFLCDKNSIILDSFAGSGTTAHAVLNLNKKDGGNRKFILIEQEDYAQSITAERVKRVIKGYGTGNKATEGTGGSFAFYRLGEPLFIRENVLNEDIGIEKIREYIFYTETRKTIENQNVDNYYLGENNDTAYYFYYEKDRETLLDTPFLVNIKAKASMYVIYADVCLLSDAQLKKYNIIFKKIPRDIKKL